MPLSRPTRRRLLLAAVALLTVALGLLTKRYSGPLSGWVRGSSGAMLYEVLWIALAQLIWLKARSWRIALCVFLATCGVELLQLYNPPWLVAVRQTFPGKMLLGTNNGFDPLDLLHYALGSALGLLIVARLRLAPAQDATRSGVK
jgi:Protein of unknown function (DUF2809)